MDQTCYWFLFDKNQLLLQKEDNLLTIPTGKDMPFPVKTVLEVPFPDDTLCKTAVLDSSVEEDDTYVLMDLRATWSVLEESLYLKAGKASQFLYWDKHSRFCPACGVKTKHLLPNMKKCLSCGYELYPVISPAILVLIRKEEEVLLVHARNFRGPFHSLVAGFLEPGETLEECVVREVMEETGLSIKNVTFFGNQPWPYPSGLMVGYVADYSGGEIRLQKEELSSGAFYSKENLPLLPGNPSLARRMIDWWISGDPL